MDYCVFFNLWCGQSTTSSFCQASLLRCASTQSQLVWTSGICCCRAQLYGTQCADPMLSTDRFRSSLKPNFPCIATKLSILCQTTGLAVICNFWHRGTLALRAERQSAPMSKITNDGLTRSGTGCFYSWTHKATLGIKGLNLGCFQSRPTSTHVEASHFMRYI